MDIEIEYAKLTPTPAFIRKENKSDVFIAQNYKLFLDTYYNLAEKLKIESKENSKSYICDLLVFGAHIFYEGEFYQHNKSRYPVITIKKLA